jgi:hypothetical protein
MEQRFWHAQPRSLAAAESDATDAGGGAPAAPPTKSDAADAGNTPPAAPGDVEARDALEKRAAEQLLGDEALRADLTDDEFQPLQDWALACLHERVAALADPAAPEAETEVEHAVECLRTVLRAANDTIGHRADRDEAGFAAGLAEIPAALEPALYGAEGPAVDAEYALTALAPELAARKDALDGVDIATALVAALRGEHPAAGGTEPSG